MEKLEIILNLWYIYDDKGFVYSLRARAYIRSGSDEEKLKYLHEHALSDYLIAQPFELPSWCKTNFISGNDQVTYPVIHYDMLKIKAPNILSLFEDAMKQIDEDLPIQSNLSIPQEPLVVITPLHGNSKGNIKPDFTRTGKI